MARRSRAVVEQDKMARFLERTARILGTTEKDVRALLDRPRLNSVRINRLSDLPPEQIIGILKVEGFEFEPIPWCPDAFVITHSDTPISHSEMFSGGHIYIQNASSLVPVLALAPQPGDSVLDVCAAPGGKASHIASMLRNDCELWLNDAFRDRVAKLRQVVDLYGARVAEITCYPGQYIHRFVDRKFDRILLDAYCSAEGLVIPSQPRTLQHWSEKHVRENGQLQRRMLLAAWELLKPGGTLVYSTCTFGPEENEAPVNRLIRERGARIEPVDIPIENRRPGFSEWEGNSFHHTLINALRIVPTERMEGFFVCKLTKGKPFAGVINPKEYEQYQTTQKERLFTLIDEVQQRNHGRSSDEIEADIAQAVRKYIRRRMQWRVQRTVIDTPHTNSA